MWTISSNQSEALIPLPVVPLGLGVPFQRLADKHRKVPKSNGVMLHDQILNLSSLW